MKINFRTWEDRLASLEEAVRTGRANTFTETQATSLYNEIREHNSRAVSELNALCGKKQALRDAIILPEIRVYIAELRIDRKMSEISRISQYDRRAHELRDSVAAKQRRNYG